MPPSIDFVAPIIRAAKATLEADLPTQIIAFNAEAENTIDLVNPVAYVFGAQDPVGVGGFPVVECAAVTGQAANFAVENVEWDDFVPLQVVVWHEGARGEVGELYEAALGYARCVIEALAVPGALGSGVEIVTGEGGRGIRWRVDPFPEDLSEDGRDFAKWRLASLVQFELEAIERRVA